MIPDPIIDELHALRERKAAALNNDLRAMAADARKRQGTSGHKVASYPPRPPRKPLRQPDSAATKKAG